MSNSTRASASVAGNVVLDLFPGAMSLADYAMLVTGNREAVLRIIDSDSEHPRLKALCHNTLVVPEADPPQNIPLNARTGSPSAAGVQSILNRLITQVVKSKTSFRDQNCLALGYRAKGDHTNAGIRGNMDVECYYVNTIHSHLSTTPWQLLTMRLGDAFLMHLLTRPVFVATKNGCFMQVAGPNVGQLLYQGSAAQSMQARNFFVKRRENRTNMASRYKRRKMIEELGGGTFEAGERGMDACQVRGSTQLPRFDLFYKSRDRKIERFLADEASMSGRTLLVEVYGQVRSFFSADTSEWLVHSAAASTLLLELQRPLLAAVNRYRQLDVLEVLKNHCANKNNAGVAPPAKRDTQEDSLPHRKARRGCRAGISVKQKVKTKPPDIPYEIELGRQGVEKFYVRRSSSTDIEPSSSSVGQRILRRIVRVARQGIAQEDEGYISQEGAPISSEVNSVTVNAFDNSSVAASEFEYSGASAASSDVSGSASTSSRLHSVMLSASTQESGCAFNIERPHATTLSVDSSGSLDPMTTTDHRSTNKISRKRKFAKPSPDSGTECTNHYTTEKPKEPTVAAVDFINMCTPENDICEFIKSVVRRCFTVKEVWGTRHNLNRMLKSIDKYLRLGRNETFTVAQMCDKLQLAEIPWLRAVERSCNVDTAHPGEKRSFRCAVGVATHSHTQQIILHAFVYWLIADFIHPLICAHLYATEAEGRGNQVLWYRKSAWTQIVRAGLAQIQPHFVKIVPWVPNTSPNTRTSDHRRGALLKTPANIRFLPKKTSVRAITNLRSRPNANTLEKNKANSTYSQDSSTVSNTALYNCLHVLKRLFSLQPALAGFGTFGIDDIYERFKNFRLMIESRRAASDAVIGQGLIPAQCQAADRPPFYVAVLDLEKCYDNVDTAQLFNLVKDLVEKQPFQEADEGCVLHRYTVAHRIASMERAITKSIRHVSTEGDIFSFDEAVSEISVHYRNSIIADGVVHPKMTKQDMLRLLRLHLFSHVVRMPSVPEQSSGNKNLEHGSKTGSKTEKSNQFTQIKGIPQGSVLSPILCNLYYGHAEQEIFGTEGGIEILGLVNRTLVLRMMDDYIVVSTDKIACNFFLQRAHIALRPFGGGVNPLKTRVNFDTSIELGGHRIPLKRLEGRDMPWCGFLVDTQTLEIKPCMKRMLERPLRLATSVECGQTGLVLRRAMKSFVRTKCHAIVLDSSINSYTTVCCSVYTIFLVAAMRTHVCIRAMQSFCISKNASYIVQCIDEAIVFGARLIHSRTSKRSNRMLVLGAENDYETSEQPDASASKAHFLVHKSIHVNGSEAHGRCDVSHRRAVWLGFRAFLSVLSKRNGHYYKVIKAIRAKMAILDHVLKNDSVFEGQSGLEECDDMIEKTVWM